MYLEIFTSFGKLYIELNTYGYDYLAILFVVQILNF